MKLKVYCKIQLPGVRAVQSTAHILSLSTHAATLARSVIYEFILSALRKINNRAWHSGLCLSTPSSAQCAVPTAVSGINHAQFLIYLSY